MNRTEAKALREQRAQVIADQRKLLDAAAAAGRDLTAEEVASYDKLEARAEELKATIARVEKLEAEEALLAAASGARTRGDIAPAAPGGADAEAEKRAKRDKVNRAIDQFLRYGLGNMLPEDRAVLQALRQDLPDEIRAQTVTTTGGGYLIAQDTSLAGQIEIAMLAYGGMLADGVGTVIQTGTGANMPWPTVNDTSNEGVILPINTAETEQALTFGTISLDAFVFSSRLVLVPVQLIQDSAVNIDQLLGRMLGERLGRILNRYFTTGTGSSQPNGVVTASTAGVTAASSTAITADELIDLVHSVDPSYRANGRFMFEDTTLRELKQLKDSQNRYLWLPGLAVREPDTINGFPFTVNQHMSNMQASAKSVLFGDFSKYIKRMVLGMTMLRLEERYAEYLQVGFMAYMRADGDLSDAGTRPIKHIVHPSP